MSVKAKIIIDEKEINVLSFSFGFNQGADTNGRPFQKPVFVGLELMIETRKDLNLADWAFASNQTKQLELHIYPVIMGKKTRKLYFYDCHLLHWGNHFSSTGNEPMSETLNISAAGVKDSNSTAEYSAYWRETFADNMPITKREEEIEEEEIPKASISPNIFIAGSNVVAKLKRLDGKKFRSSGSIEMGNFSITNYWVDKEDFLYFIPPKTSNHFETEELTIDGELLEFEKKVAIEKNPSEAITSLNEQLDILHELSNFPENYGLSQKQIRKDKIIMEGQYRFETSLRELAEKYSNKQENKLLAKEISNLF